MTALAFPSACERETLVHPPGAASLANFFAQPGLDCTIASSAKLTAWLDRTDRVISLPNPWQSLATLIGMPDMNRDDVLGRPVGRFIADPTVRECFRLILEGTRRAGQPVRIVSRCDRLDGARALQLRFGPMSAGAIECTWALIDGPAAERIPALQRRHFRDGELLRMCGWCRQVQVAGVWQRLEIAAATLGLLDHRPLPPVTHGICPQCTTSMVGENVRAIRERVAV